MAILTLTVARQETDRIEKLLGTGRFQSVEELIQQGLQRPDYESNADSAREQSLLLALQEGTDNIESGHYTELHSSKEITQFMKRLSQKATESVLETQK